MRDKICKAIMEKRRVRIYYQGGHRVIEPHAFGYDSKGKWKLRAYQISGYSSRGETRGWKLFNVSDIKEFQLLEEHFERPRPGYNPRGDKMIPTIVCKI